MAKLDRYHEKRDFTKTPEPEGVETNADTDLPRFVVQQHKATRMHYDVRFEVDGTMPSWAVPKGPSYDPKVKRLAVHVEDHPLDYQSFEGIIPKGEYGAGPVIVWDAGTYRNITQHNGEPLSMRDAIERGHVSVWFEGEKLQGSWALTRTSAKASSTSDHKGPQEQWLMVKRADEHADPTFDVTAKRPESVATGRTLQDVLASNDEPKWTRDTATWVAPMLATLTKTNPIGDDWIYERKLDGLRCIAVRNGAEVHLWSRNRLSFDARFPEIIEALRALPADNFVLDGELVAYSEGATSFLVLQQDRASTRPMFAVFDLVHLLGNDVRHLPLLERKALLRRFLNDVEPPLQLVEPLTGDCDSLLETARVSGWEGLIAKQPDERYVSGRSTSWRKLKCVVGQELVIAGWTAPKGARVGFGALLVGHFDDSGLRYAGKVGTGFDGNLLRSLHAQLVEREIPSSPFADPVPEKAAHWARPELVAQVGFSEWTTDGRLRHPRFEGLRPDKDPRLVRREDRSGDAG